jgi:CHAD domain-containing protein
VFDVVQALLETVELHPSSVSKAQRGYRLRHGGLPRPTHASNVELDPGFTPRAAACAVTRAALAQVQANDEGVLASDDPEYVHQLRVGLRRLRSALRVFKKPLAATLDAHVKETLRWITGIAGDARDLDVLALQTVPNLVAKGADAASADALQRRLERERDRARTTLRKALWSARYARCILALAHALQAPPGDDRPRGVQHFACRRLDKLLEAFATRASDIEHLEDGARHAVRIRAKRLRYGLDALGALFKAKDVKRYAGLLSAVQDGLGQANDAVAAQRLLARIDADSAFTQFARGALRTQAEAALGDLAEHVRRLRTARAPWRST